MWRELIHRVGTFVVLLGMGILVLFVASASSGSANFDYLFWAMLAVLLGFFVRGRRPPPEPSNRFRLLSGLKRPGRGRRER